MMKASSANLSQGSARHDFRAIFDTATRRCLAPGASLLAEGERSRSLHLVAEGWAYRYTTSRHGARQITAVLLPGDLANLDCLSLDRSDYGIRALTPVSVLCLPRSRALSLAVQQPEVMRTILMRMAIENAMLGRWALCLGRKPALDRLAHFLCELALRLTHEPGGDSLTFALPLTQEQMADILGITTVHVNRMLQHLRSQDLVRMARKEIAISSLAALAGLGEFDPAYLHREELAMPEAVRTGRNGNHGAGDGR